MAQGMGNLASRMTEMDRTRASMLQKLSLIEERVNETIEHARTSVADVVDRAETAAEDIVDRVEDFVDRTKLAFDPRHQMRVHPWLMLAGVIAIGYGLGRMQTRGELTGKRGQTPSPNETVSDSPIAGGAGQTIRVTPNIWDSVAYRAQDELDALKGAAGAAAESLVRDLFRNIVPALLKPLERAARERINRAAG